MDHVILIWGGVVIFYFTIMPKKNNNKLYFFVCKENNITDCNIRLLTCQFFINADGEVGLTEEEGERYGWLEEIEVPENSEMDGIEYLGPQIDDSSF